MGLRKACNGARQASFLSLLQCHLPRPLIGGDRPFGWQRPKHVKEMTKSNIELAREVLNSGSDLKTFYTDYFIPELYLKPALDDSADGATKLLEGFLKVILINNVDFVEQLSESPIERLFLHALHLISSINISPYFLRFTPSPDPISEYITGIRETYNWALQCYSELSQLEDFSEERYEAFIDWMVSEGTITEKQAADLRFFPMAYKVMGFERAFHITIQARFFQEIRINGRRIRPDLYVWHILDESFRLIVECDGFSVHGNKRSFTADRQRDRKLKTLGYDVFRFSGPEIFRDPFTTAKELVSYLHGLKPFYKDDEQDEA